MSVCASNHPQEMRQEGEPSLRIDDGSDSSIRLLLLLAAVSASIMLPFFVIRHSNVASDEAASWVVHSEQVRSATYEIMYTLRDVESWVLKIGAGVDGASARPRYESSRQAVDPLLNRLRELTLDNPVQQTQVGAFQNIAAGRLVLFNQSLEKYAADDRLGFLLAIVQAQDLFPISEITGKILAEENRLLSDRVRLAISAKTQARWIAIVAAIVQALVLGALILFFERRMRTQRRADADARGAIARSQQMLETMHEPIALLDADLHLLKSNLAFERLYATGPDRSVGKTIDGIGKGAWSDPVLIQRLRDTVASNRELWDYEATQITHDTIRREMLINARRMNLPNQLQPAVLLSVSDITTRKFSEKRIIDLNSQLAAKVEQVSESNRELEAFSHSVSHDLRAPLRHIVGFAQKLRKHLGDQIDEQGEHCLGVVENSAKRMSMLIEDLLVYSRLGRNVLRMQPVDMQTLVEDTKAMLINEAGDRKIFWKIAPLPVIAADENMMRLVWQNLIGNALKYTSKVAEAQIEIGLAESDSGEYVFTVKDNGAGFDPNYADKLFGVFQRLHSQADFPGTGIGLANVRRIVARHGGRVWADAALNEGATFSFSIPRSA